MFVIDARNVNDAWYWAKKELAENHITRPSRVGEVWEHPEPVATVYRKPLERVLFDAKRDANPFFGLFESLWMLAGRNDIAWLLQFNKRMAEFSDDGVIQHGAYGYRWRNHFDLDQLDHIVEMLKRNHDERRAVLQMWDPILDLNQPKLKDVPCNTNAYFKIRSGCLCMVVCCRSNDIIWGCYGANAVHFSVLLEYMAARIGVPVGTYTQISDSWHAYTERWEKYVVKSDPRLPDPYGASSTPGVSVGPYPLMTDSSTFDMELNRWIASTEMPLLDELKFSNPFFPQVAQPLFMAWQNIKNKNYENAMLLLQSCRAQDWKRAAEQWVNRRRAKVVPAGV